MNPTLEIRNVGMQFGGLTALSGVTATLTGPGAVGLIGPNGAGKSTLLNTLSGFYAPTSGEIILNGQDVTALDPQSHAKAGIIRSFQTAQLLEEETAVRNVLLGRQRFVTSGPLRQMFFAPKHIKAEREWLEQAYSVLDTLQLLDIADTPVSALSTATRRLVEIARVLIAEPSVILLDEPAAGLDANSRCHLAETLRSLPERAGCLLVLVEHDVTIVRRSCERSIALVAGQVLADGPTDDVLDDPTVRLAYFGESHAAA